MDAIEIALRQRAEPDQRRRCEFGRWTGKYLRIGFGKSKLSKPRGLAPVVQLHQANEEKRAFGARHRLPHDVAYAEIKDGLAVKLDPGDPFHALRADAVDIEPVIGGRAVDAYNLDSAQIVAGASENGECLRRPGAQAQPRPRRPPHASAIVAIVLVSGPDISLVYGVLNIGMGKAIALLVEHCLSERVGEARPKV